MSRPKQLFFAARHCFVDGTLQASKTNTSISMPVGAANIPTMSNPFMMPKFAIQTTFLNKNSLYITGNPRDLHVMWEGLDFFCIPCKLMTNCNSGRIHLSINAACCTSDIALTCCVNISCVLLLDSQKYSVLWKMNKYCYFSRKIRSHDRPCYIKFSLH